MGGGGVETSVVAEWWIGGSSETGRGRETGMKQRRCWDVGSFLVRLRKSRE